MPTKLLNNIVLSEFVEMVLGPISSMQPVSPAIAQQIIEIDTEESICHIEWPSGENGFTKPHMWRIEDWRTSVTRETQRKALAAKERTIAVRVSELREVFVKRLMAATGSPREVVEALATGMIRARNLDAARMFNVDISELLAADDELQSYKTQIRKK